MRRKLLHSVATVAPVIALTTVDLGGPQLTGVGKAHASGPGVNVVVGFLRIIGAANRRRRVYREARTTQEGMNEYYDRLIAKAQSTRAELAANAATGDTPPRFIRAYVWIEAALRAEHASATQQIEAEKNQARQESSRALGQEIVKILTQSPGGQQLISRVRETLQGVRQAAIAVQTAANAGRPLETLKETLASQYSDIPQLQRVVRNLGSMVGNQLDRALGGVLSRIEAAMDDVEGGMGQALEVVDQLDTTVAHYSEQERMPISLVEDNGRLRDLVPVDRANAALDVAATAYAGGAALHGALEPGTSKGEMRDRIKSALLQQHLDGLHLAGAEHSAGQVFCSAVGRAQYEVIARQVGRAPETPRDPEQASYLVCYDIQTGAPVYAYMVGPTADPTPTPDGPTPTPEDTTATPTPSPAPDTGQAIVAQGSFLPECEKVLGCMDATVEMEFYPEGGPVTGTGIYGWYDVEAEIRTLERWELAFRGQSDGTGHAGGPVGLLEGGRETHAFLWEAEYADGIFEGYIRNPALSKEGDRLIRFRLRY